MIFRQLFDRESCTYTYLLADEQTREAVLIDPVRELIDRDAQVVAELRLGGGMTAWNDSALPIASA